MQEVACVVESSVEHGCHIHPPISELFGVDVHRVTMEEAIAWALHRVRSTARGCELIFTPNVDHVVQLSQNDLLRDAYESASLVIADGWPVVAASRWLSEPLPARVPGSELVPQLIGCAGPIRVFLLGGGEGVAELAAERLLEQFAEVEIVGTDSPPFGFENCEDECGRIVAKVNAASPDLLVVGFGAPKQELWLAQHQSSLNAKVAIAAGGTIDFLAGRQIRAPRWIQQLGLEWMHRLMTNPRRLARRYLKGAIVFPQLVLREYYGKRICRPAEA